MMIQLEMGPNFQRTVAELGSMGRSVLDACSAGLGKGVKIAAGNVVSKYLSGQALKRRSGHLAQAVDGWAVSDTEAIVGINPNSTTGKTVENYKWLLSDEEKTIIPKKGKFLTVPIGESLTSTGRLKDKYSEGLRSITEGFFVRAKTGGLLFGIKHGKRGKFRPLFVLVKSVLVQGTGALYDGVDDSLDDITEQMQAEIDRKVK